MFDSAIIEHRFTPYLRDYDVIVDVPAASPINQGSYIAARYRYRFTHCVLAQITTAVKDQVWRESWADVFTDFTKWEQAGAPYGYVWGVCFSDAYPGLRYVDNSPLAREWSDKLNHPMHEIVIETNGHNIRLVFHDVQIQLIAKGDPATNSLIPMPDADNASLDEDAAQDE